METLKAGCVLVDVKNKKIGLVYREKQNDFSFPKGHLESGETFKECALRETAEEIKRDAKIIEVKPYEERYTTPSGEDCLCYMFLAIDNGKSDNDSTDTHTLVWVDIDKVEDVLTYPSLKKVWGNFKENVYKLI